MFELYSVPIDGSTPPIELNPSFGGQVFRDVLDFQLTPDGKRVVYRANQEFVLKVELFVVPVDRAGPLRKLNGKLVQGGGVSEYALSPDGTRVLYTADQDTDEVLELYTNRLTGKLRKAP